ncbi:unnamed protein product [Medioppia subpectinata]|uniref:Uroporphyrinogen-III synthase n=1 Tax=Medioppia subpectinata TaxID=1979941 RepID=A0A7R9Q1Y4_9ACAR|nr:unnamed protein product [Medioppia subpectinata]CAG2108914.1 unnamed protein product [Medioppia subpectinata]
MHPLNALNVCHNCCQTSRLKPLLRLLSSSLGPKKSDIWIRNDMNDDYNHEIRTKSGDNALELIHLSPIEFTFCNINQLSDALLDVHNWSALCLTSKRCVDAIEMAINCHNNHNVMDLWIKNNKRVFVVGIKSYEYLRDRLHCESIGSDCGNADNLAQLMVSEYGDELIGKEVLFPCSESRSDSLPQSLANASISVKEIIVYKTTTNRHLESKAPEVKSPLRLRLESWLNKNMKILMSDGRTLVGIFLCTDRDRNVILGSCLEYLKPNDDGSTEEPRVLGLAMIPGPHIVSIHVDKPHPIT